MIREVPKVPSPKGRNCATHPVLKSQMVGQFDGYGGIQISIGVPTESTRTRVPHSRGCGQRLVCRYDPDLNWQFRHFIDHMHIRDDNSTCATATYHAPNETPNGGQREQFPSRTVMATSRQWRGTTQDQSFKVRPQMTRTPLVCQTFAVSRSSDES